jgi:hypothetical protein
VRPGLGQGTLGRRFEHRTTPSFLWPQVDLVLTSPRPRRTWAQGSPWWPRGSCPTVSPPSAPLWSLPHQRFTTR